MFDLVVLDLVFICNGLLCIFVFLCVSLDHFGFVFSNLVLLGLVFFSTEPRDWHMLPVIVVSSLWHGYFVSGVDRENRRILAIAEERRRYRESWNFSYLYVLTTYVSGILVGPYRVLPKLGPSTHDC